ncbi:MAG: CotH kinase family protein [Planctomycetota bacterium]
MKILLRRLAQFRVAPRRDQPLWLLSVATLVFPSRKRSDRRQRPQGLERLEDRHLLAAQPILSEFVASNDSTLEDGFGEDSDWIEVRNAGDMPVDLQGYHLTDNAGSDTKWEFPESTILGPGEYLVVFASGEDTQDPLGFWHTNFRLSAGGEYVGLTDPLGTTLSEFNAGGVDYPPQLTDVSYGLAGTGEPLSLIGTDDTYFYQVPTSGVLGTSWTNVGFAAAANGFATGSGGLGYENSPGATINYNAELDTFVPSGTTSAYLRYEFSLAAASGVSGMTLSLLYDDGFAAYLNGSPLFDVNAPGTLSFNSAALDGSRPDGQVLGAVDFSLDDHLALLQDGDNVLAIHALNAANSSDMLLSAQIVATIEAGIGSEIGYLATPTPGTANTERIDLGPVIRNVEFSPKAVAAGTPIVVMAEVSESVQPVNTSSVRLHYRRMFDTEVAILMVDNGTGADAVAGDGVYTATIPSVAGAGEMIRWYVTAEDNEGTLGRAPRFADPVDSPEYFGTVVIDPNASDDLPVMYWFVEDEAAAQTRAGTRASLYYLGEFYDNIQVDLHGQSTAGTDFPKKSYDFDSNTGEKFRIVEGIPRHSDFNLLTNYADQSKLRHSVAYAAFAEAGAPHHLAFPVSVHRNGAFYGLYDVVEQGDEEHLERLGLDPNGALYKVNNNLDGSNAAFVEVEKLTRDDEDRSDLQEVVDANDLTGIAATRWDYDNLDTASLVNYLAMQTVIANGDFGHKNQYFYRDSNETLQWQILPWDLDLSFGHQWNRNVSPPYFDNTLYTTTSPFFGFNDIVQRQYNDTRFREMYFRRIRTLSDQILGSPGDPVSESWAYQQFEQRYNAIADEAVLDTAEWGIHPNFTRNPEQAVDQIQNTYIPQRRSYLTNLRFIPDAQVGTPDITFDTLNDTVGTGPSSEDYFVLRNNGSTAADLSGWTIAGAVSHTLKPGTVIPANNALYLVSDVQGFLARTTGPGGNRALLIQGNYGGELSPAGGTLTLVDSGGTQVAQLSYAGNALPGDANGDGAVDLLDLDILGANFGASPATLAQGDFNANNVVDLLDLDILGSNFGATNVTLATLEANEATTVSDESEAVTVGLLLADEVANKPLRPTIGTSLRGETLRRTEVSTPAARDDALLLLANSVETDSDEQWTASALLDDIDEVASEAVEALSGGVAKPV